MGYYPIAVDLTDRGCLVVGGGEVALRKVQALVAAGARVTVVAPEIDPRIGAIEGVRVILRAYRRGDMEGCALTFAATDDHAVNSAVSEEARERGAHVNVVDEPALCSFIVPAVVRRGDLMIAVTTSGKSPALSKRLRGELESLYGEEYAAYLDLLGEMRGITKERYALQADREAAFRRLLESGILELLREGRAEEAREKALQCIW